MPMPNPIDACMQDASMIADGDYRIGGDAHAETDTAPAGSAAADDGIRRCDR